MQVLWFGVLVLWYLMYVLMYLDTGCGFEVFHAKSACTVCQTFLLLGPAYGVYLWRRRGEMVSLDYHAVYLPFVVWYITFSLVGQKAAGNLLVESTIVALCLRLYLLRFPISRRSKTLAPNGWAVVLLVVISVALIVPPFLE
jgi:hypothetical protein